MNIEKIEKQIVDEYNSFKYTMGWRLLNTKVNNIKDNNGIFIITINPGTGKGTFSKNGHTLSNEDGNSLLHEKWVSPLQNQLSEMLKLIWERYCPKQDYSSFVESIMQGYFIPFRSRSIKDLEKNSDTMNICIDIWREIILCNLDTMRMVNCIGKKIPYKNICNIIENINGVVIIERKPYKTGWGNIMVEITKYKISNRIISVVGYPHLSQFKLFGRDESSNAMKKVILYSL